MNLQLSPRPDQPVTIIAIDGRSAAGKSTLSGKLSELLHAPVIHMDDFFLPPELRTAERLAEPGGNVHYERFQAEVAGKLQSPEAFQYQRFDCRTARLAELVPVPASRLRIVEGAYCMRPEWRSLYTVKLFVTIRPEKQKERLLARNGAEAAERFLNRWIPLEEAYIQANAAFFDTCIQLEV